MRLFIEVAVLTDLVILINIYNFGKEHAYLSITQNHSPYFDIKQNSNGLALNMKENSNCGIH
jgi:hypothetical protein